jgi:hypothetical protein
MAFLRTAVFGLFLTAATAASAQSTGPFTNTYNRNVFCAAAGVFMVQSSAGGSDFSAIDYWLSATTAEGTRLGYSSDKNKQAVDKEVADISGMAANGRESNVRDGYRQYCNAN